MLKAMRDETVLGDGSKWIPGAPLSTKDWALNAFFMAAVLALAVFTWRLATTFVATFALSRCADHSPCLD